MKAIYNKLTACLTSAMLWSAAEPCRAQSAISTADKGFENTTSIKYIAVGGSLAYGVSDGGITLESQKAAYPNLVAKQLGIADFRQATFEGLYRNGTGKIKATLSNNVLVFSSLIDGLFGKLDKLPKVTGTLDNLALPYLKIREIGVAENEPSIFAPNFKKDSYRFLNRLVDVNDEGKIPYLNVLRKQIRQADFFSYELGIDDFIDYFLDGAYGQNPSFVISQRESGYPEDELIKLLISSGGKGVIANVPNVLALPRFNLYTYEKLAKKVGKSLFIQRYGKNDIRLADPRDRFLPTLNTAKVLAGSGYGSRADNPIQDEDVIDYGEVIHVESYNAHLQRLAATYNLPVVDLYGLYNKVLSGTYVTEDGLQIDPSYPSGNFFSADGIHPSSVGQAVIANEFIKTINANYDSNFPLLSVQQIR